MTMSYIEIDFSVGEEICSTEEIMEGRKEIEERLQIEIRENDYKQARSMEVASKFKFIS